MKHPRLEFRPVSAGFIGDLFGSDWPPYVRTLAGKSGVYVIRERFTKQVLYVGESHTNRLKKTLLRHFQAWSGKTAGQRYGRGAVEISCQVTAPAAAVARQNTLIAKLRPRDNSISPAGPMKSENPF